jgi:hypothetical protein
MATWQGAKVRLFKQRSCELIGSRNRKEAQPLLATNSAAHVRQSVRDRIDGKGLGSTYALGGFLG